MSVSPQISEKPSDKTVRVLFLDDMVTRWNMFRKIAPSTFDIQWCPNARTAINALQNNEKYDIVFLDHDLGEEHYREYFSGKPYGSLGGPPTGRNVAEEITQLSPKKTPQCVVVHTHNPHGREAIMQTLKDVSARKIVVPFGLSEFQNLLKSIKVV